MWQNDVSTKQRLLACKKTSGWKKAHAHANRSVQTRTSMLAKNFARRNRRFRIRSRWIFQQDPRDPVRISCRTESRRDSRFSDFIEASRDSGARNPQTRPSSSRSRQLPARRMTRPSVVGRASRAPAIRARLAKNGWLTTGPVSSWPSATSEAHRKNELNHLHTLRGLFSTVSTPMFAST